MLKDSLIKECVQILKRVEVKQEMKELFAPLVEMVIAQIYPYLYLCLMFVLISFVLHLGIFFLLLRNKSFFPK